MSEVWMDGKLIGTVVGPIDFGPAVSRDVIEDLRRVDDAMKSVTVSCTLAQESADALHRLWRTWSRRETLRYQLKRKGKPGWRKIRIHR